MNKKTILLSAAVAGMVGAGTLSSTPAFAKGKGVHCYGLNSCGGKGACKTEGLNECKGKNSCKGKGFKEMSETKCKKKGGSTETPKA